MKTLKDIDVLGKRVLVRADLDVDIVNIANPKSEIRNPNISDTSVRLQNLKPTVEYLISHNAKQIVIAGHIGRPENRRVGGIGEIGKSEISDESENQRNQKIGESDYYDEKLSTRNLVPVLEKLLGQKITFSPNVILGTNEVRTPESDQADSGYTVPCAPSIDGAKARMTGRIVLLENLRFWDGEEKNDPEFAKQLANLADIYINEAFGACHRSHASIVGVPALLPHAAGFHFAEEVRVLGDVMCDPVNLVVLIGGAKLETKMPLIKNVSDAAEWVLVGGLIAKEVLNSKFKMPENAIVATLTSDTKDIDDQSISKFRAEIKKADKVVWNGPMGLFEEGFEKGTLAVANAIINSGAYSIIGGGETTEFLQANDLLSGFSFVSSGGGAMLEFLAGKELPGIQALA